MTALHNNFNRELRIKTKKDRVNARGIKYMWWNQEQKNKLSQKQEIMEIISLAASLWLKDFILIHNNPGIFPFSLSRTVPRNSPIQDPTVYP